MIERFLGNGDEDIVILTYKTEKESILAEYIIDEHYKYKKKSLLFSTCRKFKGLEADAIIIVDVDETLFKENDSRRFYVGTSRARFDLAIVANMSEDTCKYLMNEKNIRVGKNVYKSMATSLNSIYWQID